jgi:molecular chaperone GrpE
MSETPQPTSNPDDGNTPSPHPIETPNLEGNPAAGGVTPPTEAATPVPPDLTATAAPEAEPAVAADPAPEIAPETIEPPLSSGSVAGTGTAPSTEVEALSVKLAEISNQRDAFQSQYLRIAADFDNFRKRSSKEKEDIEVRTKCTTIIELLSVVDNFERARTQIKPQTDGEMGIHKSYQSVYKQLVEGLKRIGVSPMRPEGQQFDPNLHEAVMRQPTEEHPEGTVMEELQRGYYLGDRILRHSLVKVAAPPEQLSAEDAVDPEPTDPNDP